MSFYLRFRLLEKKDQEILTIVLGHWESVDKQVVENLKHDHFLQDDRMDFLLAQILSSYSDLFLNSSLSHHPIDFLKKKLREKIYDSLQLKGGTILGRRPEVIGTVLPVETFKNHLMKSYGSFFSYRNDALEELIQDLKDNPDLVRYDRDMASFLLKASYYLIWVSWHPENGSKSPYEVLEQQSSHELRSMLGLHPPKNKFEAPLFALSFRYDDCFRAGFELHRPTFCDADFNPMWRPTSDAKGETSHGFVYPPYGLNDIRIPEAVGKSKYLELLNLIDFFSVD